MSLDLLEAFRSQSEDPHENPWAETGSEIAKPWDPTNDDDFGEFENVGQTMTMTYDASDTNLNSSFEHPIEDSGPSREMDMNHGSSRPPKPHLEQKHTTSTNTAPSTTLTAIAAEEQSTTVKAWESEVENSKALPIEQSVPESREDEEWGDFAEYSYPTYAGKVSTEEDGPPKIIGIEQPRKSSTSFPHSMKQDDTAIPHLKPANVESRKTEIATKTRIYALAPTNIPPPSILILLIGTLYQNLLPNIKQIVLQAESNQDEQAIADFIQSKLSIIRAASRIIAGRKFRWKRDIHLSQSMKIGPAHSGKLGGMKLTGVDRTETLREDREVAEVLNIWKQQLGGLRATITSTNAHLPGIVLAVPDLSESMRVRGLRAEDGAITAPKSCVLCGLKRDERLEKVDVNVEDSFGEWWIDHWGHLDCRTFWEKYSDSLEQRR